MKEEIINNLKDVLFHLQLEGTYYYQDEENEDDYFIAYQLIVITSDQDDEDCEFELLDYIRSEIDDENLIFTHVGENSETHRVVGLPEIEDFNFENGNYTLLHDTNIVDAIEFLKNMKTINFKDLISKNLYDNKNFRRVKSIEIEETDFNKTVIEKTYQKKVKVKEEITSLILENNIVKDINGKAYSGVQIGTQFWITENLNVSKYRNGDDIPQVQDVSEWSTLKTGAWCYYDNNIENVTNFGKLYNWYAVNDIRGLAPEGFHIPSDQEWEILINYLGRENVTGEMMKAGGFRFDNGYFALIGWGGFWWSSSEENIEFSWYRYFYGNPLTRNNYPKTSGFSVRFVRD